MKGKAGAASITLSAFASQPYGFLICQQAAILPSGPTKTQIIAQFALSKAPQKPATTRKTANA
jgi:hypothetical protein